MKNIILFIGLFCTSLSGQLTVPWVLETKGTSLENLTCSRTNENKLYIGGNYRYADLILDGVILPKGFSRTSCYIGSINENGRVDWLKSIIGSNSWVNYPYFDVSRDGEVYLLISSIAEAVYLGQDTLYNPNPPLTSGAYFTKLDQDGDLLWAKSFGSDPRGSIDVLDVAVVDENETVFTVLSVSNTNFYLDTISIQNNNNSFTRVLTKWSATGNPLHSKMIDHEKSSRTPTKLIVDHEGHLIQSTNFTGDWVRMDSHYIRHPNIWWARDLHAAYLLKLDEDLNVIWSRVLADRTADVFISAIRSDLENNVIATGIFRGEKLIIGNDTLLNQQEQPDIYWDYFIAKYDPHGQPLWARALSLGPQTTGGGNIDVDSNGNIFSAWTSGQRIVKLDTFASIHQDRYNCILTKHSSEGTLLWMYGYGSDTADVANSILVDQENNLLLGTQSQGINWNFEGHQLTNTSYDSITGEVEFKLFFAKIIPPETVTSTVSEDLTRKLSIFPNPASDRLIIKNEGLDWTSVGVSLLDINGKNIHLPPVSLGRQEVIMDISALHSGTYILQLIASGEVHSQSFLVQK